MWRITVFGVLVVWCGSVWGGEFESRPEFDPCRSMPEPGVIDGIIFRGAAECNLGIEPSDTLTVNSPGGKVSEAIRMARRIWYSDITVRVVGECSSACVLLMAAADRVEVCDGARIGLHQTASDLWTERYNDFLRMTLGTESESLVRLVLETEHAWVRSMPPDQHPNSWVEIAC